MLVSYILYHSVVFCFSYNAIIIIKSILHAHLFIYMVGKNASKSPKSCSYTEWKTLPKRPNIMFRNEMQNTSDFFFCGVHILYVWPYIIWINCFRLFTKKVYKNNVIMIWVCWSLEFRFNELVDDRCGGVESTGKKEDTKIRVRSRTATMKWQTLGETYDTV